MLLTVAACGGRGGGISGGGPGQEPPQGDSTAGTDGNSLWGHTFLLTEGRRGGEPMTILADTELSLRFTDDHRVSAQAGCNTMSGPVTLDDGRLTVHGLESTGMGCDAPRHAQDEWLSGFLRGTPAWELAGPTLTLRGEDTELTLTERGVAEPARPLVGTRWTVTTLIDGQTASSGPVGTPPATMTFGKDRVEVFAGCNSGSAGYRISGDTMTFEPLVLTRKACPGEIMTLESAVVAVLEGSVTYRVESATLTLEHPSGKGLQLRAE